MTILQELQKLSQHLSKKRQPHHADAPILRVQDISVAFETGVAIKNINFELNVGERLAIVGPNGAGKSTLLKVIAGIQHSTEGKIQIFGHDPGGHICIAYVPQRNQVDWQFPVTVSDVVMMGRVGQMGLFRNPKDRDWKLVNHALKIVGMDLYSKRQISQLSVGQQQRMFIARALAQEAELILMDEPLTGLDVSLQEEMFRILDHLQTLNVTVLVSHHDLKTASKHFERVMLLNKEMLGLGMADQVLTPENLVVAYGVHLHLVPTDDGMLALGEMYGDDGT